MIPCDLSQFRQNSVKKFKVALGVESRGGAWNFLMGVHKIYKRNIRVYTYIIPFLTLNVAYKLFNTYFKGNLYGGARQPQFGNVTCEKRSK